METICTLDLSGLAAGGDAVGRTAEGQVVFVPGGAPGDRVEVALVERKRDFARGALRRVIAPWPSRVEPPCPEAAPGRCGGCPLMHVDRQAQLRAKEEWVRRALRRTLERSGATLRPILDPGPALGYRVRARLTLRAGRFGFLAARSHLPVDLRTCPVLAPALDGALFRAAAALRPSLGEGGTLAGLLGGGGAIHLAAETGAGGDRRRVRATLEALLAAGLCAGASADGHPLGAAAVDLGDEERGPLPGSADGFAQASAAGHGLLVDRVLEALGAPAAPVARWPRLLELYAGRGNLTRALLRRADEVVAVEGDPGAAAALRARPPRPGDGTLRPVQAPAGRAAGDLAAAGDRFPAVVLDPPRAGAAEVLPALARLGARRLVYVSCDPMTLGRDLGRLETLGFTAVYAQPLDLTPHAAHVEVIAVLTA